MGHKTDDEKRAILKAVDEKIAQGMTKSHAFREAGFTNWVQYKQWKKALGIFQGEARQVVAKPNGDAETLKQLKVENQRLRYIVSDLMLDKQALLEYEGRI